MGYHILNSDADNFFIAKADQDAALLAVQGLHGKETISDSGKHFSWVAYDFYKIDNLKDMLEEWRWRPTFDDDGNIVALEFTGEKRGDDWILFKALAPFVRDGSYAHFVGEDCREWVHQFNNGTMETSGTTLGRN